MARYFSITSRSPFWKWRSAPTVRNPCEGEADQPGAGCACAPPGTVLVPATGSGLSQPCSRTAWLVTTSLVKSMPSGSGICTPFLVLSAGRRHSEQRAPAPAQPLRAGGCLPLMMGMMVSCSRVFSGACSENSCGRGEDRREGECPAGGLPGRTGCACASQGLGSPPFPPCCSQLCLGAAQGGWTPPGCHQLCSPPATPGLTAWSRCETCGRESCCEPGQRGLIPAAPPGPQRGPYRRRSSCTRSAFPCRNTLALSFVS